MNIIANNLKTKGVSILADALAQEKEAIITVRGKAKYAVIDLSYYDYLRECELEAAFNDVKNDIKLKKYKIMSAKEHLST